MIYLDYAANTPVDKEVLEAFNDATIKYFGNPNSTHKLGIEANKAINDSTTHILNMLRNDYLHPEKKSGVTLSKSELKECMEYVFRITKEDHYE